MIKHKKGFTLIEMVIAVIVFSVAILLLYEVVSMLNKKKDNEIKIYRTFHHTQELKRLIYKDLLQENGISINNDKKIITFRTKNSISGISYPYVAYLLKKETLYRIESHKKLSQDLTSSMLESANILILSKTCKFLLK